jgi:hypothetical protein
VVFAAAAISVSPCGAGSLGAGSHRPLKLSRGLRFEANVGQADPAVRFLVRGRGYTLFLTQEGPLFVFQHVHGRDGFSRVVPGFPTIALDMSPEKLRVVFEGGWTGAAGALTGEGELSGRSNYFLGNDSSRWLRGVPSFERVRYRDVWPGIDVVFDGRDGLDWGYVARQNVDPREIRLRYETHRPIEVTADGGLAVGQGDGAFRQRRPRLWRGDVAQETPATYAIAGDGYSVGVAPVAEPRVPRRAEVPTPLYSTYLGGSGGDYGDAVATDSTGAVYLTGFTTSVDFPLGGAPEQPAYKGGYDTFVTKFDPSGSALVYSTYLGGSGYDQGNAIAVDSSGAAYVTGYTGSQDFPTVTPFQPASAGGYDAFVSKLSPAGDSLIYSTYLGGSGGVDIASGIAVDGQGAAWVTGFENSTDFPTLNPLQPAYGGGLYDDFVTRLSPSGASLIFSTYLGGSGQERGTQVAVIPAGGGYVVGSTDSTNFPTKAPLQAANAGRADAFIVKLDPAGGSVFSTYLGGTGDEFCTGVAIDPAGNVAISGATFSDDLPTRNPVQASRAGVFDAFASIVDSSGASLLFSTYLGGSGDDRAFGIAIDGAGTIALAGFTASGDFPTRSAFQNAPAGGYDAFISTIDPAAGTLLWSSYMGGQFDDEINAVAVDPFGSIAVAGDTFSADFPTWNPFQGAYGGTDDAFVARFVSPRRFFTIAPCRVVDTRRPSGPDGGPALAGGGAKRDFLVAGQCGVPADASAVALNITVVHSSSPGDLRLFPAGLPAPSSSVIDFPAGRARAGNAIVPIATVSAGQLTVQCDAPAGTVDLLLDVSGYFR